MSPEAPSLDASKYSNSFMNCIYRHQPPSHYLGTPLMVIAPESAGHVELNPVGTKAPGSRVQLVKVMEFPVGVPAVMRSPPRPLSPTIVNCVVEAIRIAGACPETTALSRLSRMMVPSPRPFLPHWPLFRPSRDKSPSDNYSEWRTLLPSDCKTDAQKRRGYRPDCLF